MRKETTIYFDMDGTIADLYGVEGWLDYLMNGDATPYAKAMPLMRMNVLARMLNKLQRKGYKLGVISWLAKTSTAEYDKAVAEVKRAWLKTHLASVKFDEINIVPYGTPKQSFAKSENDILFDDEKPNRMAWTGKAYDVQNITKVLARL